MSGGRVRADIDRVANNDIVDGNVPVKLTGVNISEEGQLHVVLMGKEDSGNSSTTPLNADAVFTGTPINTLDYGFIFVTILSDVASATDGLSVEQSSDGVNWDNKDEYSIFAGVGKTYSFQPAGKWFRIVYTNGGSDQTSFRLQTIFKKTSSLPSSHRISNNLSPEDDASLVLAVIKGDNPAGDFVNFKATTSGNFKFSLEELENAVSVNSNKQLKVTFFDSAGLEVLQPLTAFGDLRVAELHPQFQGSFEYTVDNTELNIQTKVNGGTVTQASGMAVVSTSTTIASMAMISSRQTARYKSGLGGLIRFTALFTAPVAATEQYVGIVDEMGMDVALGTVTLIGGASGSVDGITVNSVEIMSGAESFDTSLTETARLVAANINANTSSPNYSATQEGAVITIISDVRGTGPNTFVVTSSTTTITSTDVDLAGGTSGAAFKNGYAIGYDGTTFGFHRFQNNTKTTIAQSAWDDPLDGTGASGMTLDQTKINVFAIHYQYLGAGAIELFIESDTTGQFVLVHRINYANQNTEPSTHNPNFLFHIHAANKATTSNLIVKSSSYAYFVEGKTEFVELHQPQFASGIQEQTSVTTETAIFTLRNKSTYASKSNFIVIHIQGFSASIEASSANNLANIRVVRNTSLGGTPSFSDINTSNSVVEIDTSGTTLTGGQELAAAPLAGKNDKETKDITTLKILLHPGETLTIAGSSAQSATIRASGIWRELF